MLLAASLCHHVALWGSYNFSFVSDDQLSYAGNFTYLEFISITFAVSVVCLYLCYFHK